jgi:hypothetical protein
MTAHLKTPRAEAHLRMRAVEREKRRWITAARAQGFKQLSPWIRQQLNLAANPRTMRDTP